MSDATPSLTRSSYDTVVGIAYTLRPWQWYKQLIVLVPVAFSLQYFDEYDPAVWMRVASGVALFCGAAGSMYVINDIADVEEDRNHPEKRHRPIASGRVSVPLAVGVAAVLLPGSLVASWRLDPLFGVVVAAYVVQNLAYSYLLKQFVLIDLLLIGIGFVLRAIGGIVLVDAPMSPWLVLCAFLTALMLGIGKRQAERDRIEDETETRPILEEYSEELLDTMFASVATTLLIAYSLYTFFARDGEIMMVTLPFAFYAVFRYSYLTTDQRMERPERMFFDPAMALNLVIWTLLVLFVLYALPSLRLARLVQ